MEFPEIKGLDKEKIKSLELAEESREAEWTLPSFVAELFLGRLRWDLIMPFPLQSKEDKQIGDDLLAKIEKTLKEHIDPDEVDRTGDVPQEGIKALADLGCFAMKIPKKYDGLGLSQVNYDRAVHLVARRQRC